MEVLGWCLAVGFVVCCLMPNTVSAVLFELFEFPGIRAKEAAERAKAGPEPEWMPANVLGREGVVLGGLRPSGKIALASGEQLDVVSETGFIDAGQRVVVSDHVGARIIVSPVAGTV